MSKGRKFSVEEKSRVALEAIRGEKTIAEISSMYGVHSTQISTWKKQAMEQISAAFTGKRVVNEGKQGGEDLKKLYEKIGRLEVENDFLKHVYQRLG